MPCLVDCLFTSVYLYGTHFSSYQWWATMSAVHLYISHLQIKNHHLEYVSKFRLLNSFRHRRILEDVLTDWTHFWLHYLHDPQKSDTFILPVLPTALHTNSFIFQSRQIFQLITDFKLRKHELENSKITIEGHTTSNSYRMVAFTDILIIGFYLWSRHSWLLNLEWFISLNITHQETIDSGKVKTHVNLKKSKILYH